MTAEVTSTKRAASEEVDMHRLSEGADGRVSAADRTFASACSHKSSKSAASSGGGARSSDTMGCFVAVAERRKKPMTQVCHDHAWWSWQPRRLFGRGKRD